MGLLHHLDYGPRKVVILAFGDVTLFDISGSADVFELTNRYFLLPGARAYDVEVASITGGSVRTSSGIRIDTIRLTDIDAATIDTLIVTGGGPPDAPPIPHDLVEWLMSNGLAPARISSVCTGAFLLAAAGLLDGIRVTTHWQATSVLAESYPEIRLEADVVFVRDGRIWSSGGFTAGLDLALAMVEDDHGHDVAMKVTQSLILFLRRPGEQPQVSAPLSTQAAGDPTFARLHAWMMENLASDLKMEILAERVRMAPRTFARRYAEKIGRTPGKTVEIFRLEAARRHIVQSDASLKQIARTCGFGSEQNLRRAFLRSFGIHPEGFRSKPDPWGVLPPVHPTQH